MKTSITQIYEEIMNYYIKKVQQMINEKEIEETMNINKIVKRLREISNEMNLMTIRLLYEHIDEKIALDKENRKKYGLLLHKKGVKRTISTEFGELEYKRTYYKKGDKYEYPVDILAGIEERERIEKGFCAELVTRATEESYEKTTKEYGNMVSKQTVMNKVRDLKSVESKAKKVEEGKTPKEVHIFADEDHVTFRGGKKGIVKFAVLSEGREKIYENRNKLISPVYFATVTGENGVFWEEILGYISKKYDVEKIESIVLHADGGQWIKKAESIMPKLKVCLDEFHISKYINKLPRSKEYRETKNKIISSIKGNKKDIFREEIDKLEQILESKNEKLLLKNTKKAEKYISNNWDSIINRYTGEVIGSCTEAMTEHVCSSRISFNGCAWSRYNLEKLIKERVYILNNEKIEPTDIDKEKCTVTKNENGKKVIKAYHKKEKSIYLQYFENQMELKNESQLDFSIFEDRKPFSFHGSIKNIFSALGHKYECLN